MIRRLVDRSVRNVRTGQCHEPFGKAAAAVSSALVGWLLLQEPYQDVSFQDRFCLMRDNNSKLVSPDLKRAGSDERL